MGFRVLVATDGSEMARRALRFACETYPEADLTVLTVVGVPSWFMGEAVGLTLSDDPREAARERARPVLDDARELASSYDIEFDTAVALGSPARAIVDRAEEFDTVVIGGHGRDIGARVLVGNVAETVVRRSPVPVTVVR